MLLQVYTSVWDTPRNVGVVRLLSLIRKLAAVVYVIISYVTAMQRKVELVTPGF